MATSCPQCGKAVDARNKYCSRRCAQLARRRPASKQCEQCNEVFNKPMNSGRSHWERRRFCSRACRDEFFKQRGTFTCEGCGNAVEVPKSRATVRRFCADCNYKFAHRSRCLDSGRRLGGDSRKRLITSGYYGTCCEVCEFDRCLDLAHVIRPKNGGTMERVNILLLCPNHHRLFDRDQLTPSEYARIRARVDAAHAYFEKRKKQA
jgi:hypothetical protein